MSALEVAAWNRAKAVVAMLRALPADARVVLRLVSTRGTGAVMWARADGTPSKHASEAGRLAPATAAMYVEECARQIPRWAPEIVT